MNNKIMLLIAIISIIGISTSILQQNTVYAQTNTTENAAVNLGSFTPVVGYLSQSGGFIPINSHIMFDSESMNKLEVSGNDVTNTPINNETLNKFIEKVGSETNFRFFEIESPMPSTCIDCYEYILTITIPTFAGTKSNSVAFDSSMSFSEKQDTELILELMKIIRSL
jgi:hypothetical protein